MPAIDPSPGSLEQRLARLEQKLDRQAGLVAECTTMLMMLHQEQCQDRRRLETLETQAAALAAVRKDLERLEHQAGRLLDIVATLSPGDSLCR